jgi:hypothetical protein
VSWFGQQLGPELDDAVSLSGIVPWQGENAQALLTGPPLERAPFRADYKLRVSPLSEPSRQEQQLPLPPAKLLAGVEMNDLEHCETGNWKLENRNWKPKNRNSKTENRFPQIPARAFAVLLF